MPASLISELRVISAIVQVGTGSHQTGFAFSRTIRLSLANSKEIRRKFFR
jgi:hypothetical protein